MEPKTQKTELLKKLTSLTVEVKSKNVSMIMGIGGSPVEINTKYNFRKYYAPGTLLIQGENYSNLYLVVGMGPILARPCSEKQKGLFFLTLNHKGTFFLGDDNTKEELSEAGFEEYEKTEMNFVEKMFSLIFKTKKKARWVPMNYEDLRARLG